MQKRLLLGLMILWALSAVAQDKTVRLNVKEGLWETTVTHKTSGMPGMPADALANLPPEQRARVEEMMKQRGVTSNGNTTVAKNCVTKEKIEKGMAFANENRGNCTHTVVSSSSSGFEAKFHCEESKKDGKNVTIDGTTTVEVVGDGSTKGSTQATTKSDGRMMTMDFTFASKYLGSACGDVK